MSDEKCKLLEEKLDLTVREAAATEARLHGRVARLEGELFALKEDHEVLGLKYDTAMEDLDKAYDALNPARSWGSTDIFGRAKYYPKRVSDECLEDIAEYVYQRQRSEEEISSLKNALAESRKELANLREDLGVTELETARQRLARERESLHSKQSSLEYLVASLRRTLNSVVPAGREDSSKELPAKERETLDAIQGNMQAPKPEPVPPLVPIAKGFSDLEID